MVFPSVDLLLKGFNWLYFETLVFKLIVCSSLSSRSYSVTDGGDSGFIWFDSCCSKATLSRMLWASVRAGFNHLQGGDSTATWASALSPALHRTASWWSDSTSCVPNVSSVMSACDLGVICVGAVCLHQLPTVTSRYNSVKLVWQIQVRWIKADFFQFFLLQ